MQSDSYFDSQEIFFMCQASGFSAMSKIFAKINLSRIISYDNKKEKSQRPQNNA